jgi:hypothetical protein
MKITVIGAAGCVGSSAAFNIAIHGCELAEFGIKRGRQVTIVRSGKTADDGRTGGDKLQYLHSQEYGNQW